MAHRLVSILAGAALSAGLGGCATSNTVAFTNVSDAWLNLSYFVKQPPPAAAPAATEEWEEPAPQTEVFVARDTLQVRPGATVKYRLSRNPNYRRSPYPVVHVRVQPVNPSWQTTGTEYWLELLTEPPLTIVATGEPDGLTFLSRDGALVEIPPDQRQWKFEHSPVPLSKK